MAAKSTSTKAQAWRFFDRIVSLAAPGGHYSNPWMMDRDGALRYRPDFTTLEKLLGVPLYLEASTTTGVPALALDVWLSYELRRAGFDEDSTWPRATAPRVLPGPVASLLQSLPLPERKALLQRILSSSPTGVAPSQALILGKNYRKQVDVVMSNWSTGPEILISTKRMDSSFGKNAQNRIEEAYGDAKNLRLRHPMAALGFFFGIRSTAFTQESRTAEFIADLLHKLGEEDDAYHATCLLPIEYGDQVASDDIPGSVSTDHDGPDILSIVPDEHTSGEGSQAEQGGPAEPTGQADQVEPTGQAGHANPDSQTEPGSYAEPFDMFSVPSQPALDEPEVEWQDTFNFDQGVDVDVVLAKLPQVRIQEDFVPRSLRAGTFLEKIVTRVLAATPTTLHESARDKVKEARRG
ncbi:MAG: hypothetical protein QM705_09560 [Ancrocorticia sp.]